MEPEQIRLQELRAERLGKIQMGVKERCKRAATFKVNESVRVDDVPGIGIVRGKDDKVRGVVSVKHDNIRLAREYGADVVHKLDEEA